MPIKINNDAKQIDTVTKQIFSPKFFSKDITGSGKSTGLLNKSIYPVNLTPNVPINSHPPHCKITTEINKYTKHTYYSLSPLAYYIPETINFDALSWCHLPSLSTSTSDTYARFIPVEFTLIEPLATADDDANNKIGKRCSINYLYVCVSVEKNSAQDKACVIWNVYTENPLSTIKNEPNFTDPALYDYIDSYNIHAEICHLSEIWQTKLVDVIINAYDDSPKTFPIADIVRYIAQYKVSLEQYKDLYDALSKRVSPDMLKRLTKMNTSLLLQETLNDLSQTSFPTLPNPGTTNKSLDLSWCSKEQFDAITSASPLNLVQAGAGTGKSTVIKSRIDYLDYLGIDLSKVMVLSFTNAAADNIKARCPGICSMTIAKMIDTIYCKNHPTHQLSSSLIKRGEGSTFTNSLDLYKNSSPIVPILIDAIKRVETKNDYASLLSVVEENYDEVIKILDTIGQTTFHLEIIICYLEHATLDIPFDIEHLLIDEVQDNAVFEFVFFLNLTRKLGNHLYLVGDCSQTLYEFRASDPKAINAIEASNLFSMFPLNINYRSNQNILHFANSLLSDIEANQYANIQLQAFKLNPITKQSFTDSVIVDYETLPKLSELENLIYRKLHSPEMTDWIKEKIARKEQICILCHKRREAAIFQRELENLYPNANFANIIPARISSFAIFSNYVSNNKQQLLALPTTNVTDLCARVKAEIMADVTGHYITPAMANYNKIVASILQAISEWQKASEAVLSDAIEQFKTNAITHERLADIVSETLIDYEIQKNALKQTLVSQKNAVKKEDTDNADFIFSTIHSAKGLEYDNVILLYQNKNSMEEDMKRMYYVGLTRAKKNEYVIAYDTVVNALIKSRYDTIVNRLPDVVTPIACVS